MPKLPGWLHTLDQYRHIGPTGFVVDAGNFGQFRIHHVPEDDNCLFTAIGHFVGLDQGAVRQAIHIIAQGILNETILNPDPGVFTPEGIEAIMAMTNPETPAPLNRFNNGMEARMAAGMAAMILGRRVFIVNHFHGGDTPANEGFEANGNPITVEQIAGGQVSPINPGQDIVLYFIINPDPNPGPEERHVEALVPEAFVPEAFVPPPVMWRFFDGPPPEFGDRGLELPGWLHGLDDEHLLGPTGVAVQTPFGQFRIHHVPEDGNCLFAAIGHFVLPQLDLNPRAAQELVRRRIHDTAQGILNRRIPNPDPQQDLNPRGIRAVIHTTDPNALAQNRFGNIADARVAAIAFRRRVFIVNHFHAEGNPVFAGHHPALQGFDANGNPIDMEHLDRPINPGQGPNYDIVLYFIINLDPNRGPGELHMEALVR
jgi:hypothetical protein